MASFRLNKVAKDFNVGIQTLVEYLAKKGHQVEQSPNTKISEEQYELLATKQALRQMPTPSPKRW